MGVDVISETAKKGAVTPAAFSYAGKRQDDAAR